jgi:hypothetical protein
MKITIDVELDKIPEILDKWDQISIQRAATETGTYTQLALIPLQPGRDTYIYYDEEGTSSSWYKSAFYNSETMTYSEFSEAFRVGTEDKIGYTFRNYSPPKGTWGEALTADDIRHTYLMGLDLRTQDGNSVTDQQLRYQIEVALEQFEKYFDMDMRIKIRKTEPDPLLVQAPQWQQGVDYTDEEDAYDFKKIQWVNYGFLQLRHRPLLSIEKAGFYSAWNTLVLEILDWIRMYKKSGQIHIYPKGSTLFGKGYVGNGLMVVAPQLFSGDFPQAFKIDYTTGYKNSDYIPSDLRNAIGLLASVYVLEYAGGGKHPGLASTSVGLDGLSESISLTQSSSSTLYGARVKQYLDLIKDFINRNRAKYSNINMGMITG